MAKDKFDRIVEQWADIRPDIATLPMQAVGRIFYAARIFERRMEEVFGQFGLNRAEFDVLVTLLRTGEPHRLTPTALSQTLLLSTSAMTNRIDRLELADLVAREADPNDRRGVKVALTPAGRTLVERALDAHLDNERRLISALTEREQQTVSHLLRKVLRELDPMPEPAPEKPVRRGARVRPAQQLSSR